MAVNRRTVLAGAASTGLAASMGAAVPLAASAQDTGFSPKALDALRAAAGSPALAAAARGPGGASPVIAVGRRSSARPQPVSSGDLWHIGSITKSFTAVLAAHAVEAGLLSWTTPLSAVLPDLAAEGREAYRDLTLLHILSHRGGLEANLPMAQFLTFPRHEDDPRESRIAYVRASLQREPAGAKETSFTYSNTGYIIAGAMLEALWGAPWEHLIGERVLAPLGLASAGQGAPGTPGTYDQPLGHSAAFLLWGRRPAALTGVTDNPAVLGPAGRLHMSLDDLLSYMEAHRDRHSLLSAESWARLHTVPFGGDYALGWVRSQTGIWHNGSNTLWYAEASCDFDTGVVGVAACNDGVLARSQEAVAKARQLASSAVR